MPRVPLSIPVAGAVLDALLFEPAGQAAFGVVFSHGWGGSHRFDDLLERLAGRGAACLRFFQRGFPPSAGSPDLARWPEDMSAAAAVLESRGLGVWFGGQSTGGTMAIAACARHTAARGFFAIAPFATLPEILRDNPDARIALERRFGALSREAEEAADARAHLARLEGRPGLVVSSRADDTVPFAHGESLARAAGPSVRFLPLEQGNHVLSDTDRSPLFAAVEMLLGLASPGPA